MDELKIVSSEQKGDDHIDYARHLLSVHWTLSLAHRYIILFLGAGLATVVISFLFTTYYNVIITWAFYYLFNTFTSVLPWSFCDPEWASYTRFEVVLSLLWHLEVAIAT
jgi:SNF family Na+-dependent transporter